MNSNQNITKYLAIHSGRVWGMAPDPDAAIITALNEGGDPGTEVKVEVHRLEGTPEALMEVGVSPFGQVSVLEGTTVELIRMGTVVEHPSEVRIEADGPVTGFSHPRSPFHKRTYTVITEEAAHCESCGCIQLVGRDGDIGFYEDALCKDCWTTREVEVRDFVVDASDQLEGGGA